ncbi:hypothetical protein QJQ45_016952, partial [Haematococcus lacustris]
KAAGLDTWPHSGGGSEVDALDARLQLAGGAEQGLAAAGRRARRGSVARLPSFVALKRTTAAAAAADRPAAGEAGGGPPRGGRSSCDANETEQLARLLLPPQHQEQAKAWGSPPHPQPPPPRLPAAGPPLQGSVKAGQWEGPGLGQQRPGASGQQPPGALGTLQQLGPGEEGWEVHEEQRASRWLDAQVLQVGWRQQGGQGGPWRGEAGEQQEGVQGEGGGQQQPGGLHRDCGETGQCQLRPEGGQRVPQPIVWRPGVPAPDGFMLGPAMLAAAGASVDGVDTSLAHLALFARCSSTQASSPSGLSLALPSLTRPALPRINTLEQELVVEDLYCDTQSHHSHHHQNQHSQQQQQPTYSPPPQQANHPLLDESRAAAAPPLPTHPPSIPHTPLPTPLPSAPGPPLPTPTPSAPQPPSRHCSP